MITFSCGVQRESTFKTDKNPDLPQSFFKRWKLDYGMANGGKINGLPSSPNNDYEFKANGKYFLYHQDETYMIGTWEYNQEENIVYTRRDDGVINGKFADVKADSITLIPAGDDIAGTPFENFRFYYIPKNN